MRRAGWVALGAWLLMLVLGLKGARFDIEEEVAAAQTMAGLVSRLTQPSAASDAQLITELRRIVHAQPPRHVSLTVRDADGRVLLAITGGEPLAAPLSWLVAMHRALMPVREPPPLSWQLPRGEGRPWTVTMAVSHESERAEAVANLAGLLGLGAIGSVALLLAMGWNVHRSFRPMRSLLHAIAALRDDDARALRALPPMPIGELQAIAAALRDLADALEAAERQRRALSTQVLTLQEDERQRIARELHDEFGQRLTALRADAAWLARRVDDAQAQHVVATMATQCEALQREIRSLLTRLSPAGASDGATDLLRLQRLLEDLVQAWHTSPGQGVHFVLALEARAADGRELPWPTPEQASAHALPHELCLALYRISQEALTNVARHSQASRATLQLTLRRGDDGDSLQWQVSDDGAGLGSLQVALQRGNGLAGIRQRVWALGSDLECEPVHAGASQRAGVCLRARFRVPAVEPAQASHALAAA
jgi:two-component system sensor histidine kinase UhpB